MPFRHIGDIPPQIAGVIAAVAMSLLRMAYEGEEKSKKRAVVESVICGGLSMAAGSAIIATGLSTHWILFSGTVIGVLGYASVKGMLLKIANKKADKL